MQMQQVKLVLKAIVVVLAAILVAANHEVLTTRIRLSFFGIGEPVYVVNVLVLLAAFVLGAIVWPMIWRALFRRKQQ